MVEKCFTEEKINGGKEPICFKCDTQATQKRFSIFFSSSQKGIEFTVIDKQTAMNPMAS